VKFGHVLAELSADEIGLDVVDGRKTRAFTRGLGETGVQQFLPIHGKSRDCIGCAGLPQDIEHVARRLEARVNFLDLGARRFHLAHGMILAQKRQRVVVGRATSTSRHDHYSIEMSSQ
jgi:hypothetical protein